MQTHLRYAVALGIAGFLASDALAQFAVKSVGSVQKKDGPMQVTVVFSEAADPTTATDKTKYSLGAGITVNNVTMMTGLPADSEAGNGDSPPSGRVVDNQCVVLEVTGLSGTASKTLTVNGVKNASGAATLSGATKTFIPSGYNWVDVATRSQGGKASQVIAISDEGFDIFNNGRTGWGNEDEYTLIYKEVTGDFEFQARVEFQDFGSRWSRAGIMVRERLDDGTAEGCMGRYVSAHADPVRSWSDSAAGVIGANNSFESNYRNIDYSDVSPGCGDGSHTTFGNDTSGNGGGTPEYPNAWVRLTRVGDEITAYYASDTNDWQGAWVRTFESPLPAKMYLGPAYCVEWGNINAANGTAARSRLYMSQIRFKPILTPTLKSFQYTPLGFTYTVEDSQTAVNISTVELFLDGTKLISGVNVNKVGTTTTVSYKSSTPFPSGERRTAKLMFKDNATPPFPVTMENSFTPTYATIPASYALAGAATGAGMTARTYQIDFARTPGDENSIANAEQELIPGYVDPATGTPYPNVAAGSSFNITVVNWEQTANDIDATPEDGPDNFNSALPAASPAPNDYIPGIPGGGNDQGHTGTEAGSADNNIVVEVVTYLNLKAGMHRMGVNSDDGFKVSAAAGQGSPFGVTLGSYNTGRGAGDTLFDFLVQQDGYYPVRLLWWEGAGGANCEWFTVNLDTGERLLVNGTQANAVKAFRTGQGRAYVKSLSPASGFGGAARQPTVKAELANGRTSVAAGSVKLILDGAEVASGGTLSISYAVPRAFEFGSPHTGSLIWTESTTPPTTWTNDFSFSVAPAAPDDLPVPGAFWIEAEDFDYNRGQSVAAASVMPYTGGGYEGLVAVYNVDYNSNNNNPDTDAGIDYVYRTDQRPRHVDVTRHEGAAALAMDRPGATDATVNYRIGWAGGNQWWNYTRRLPAGVYRGLAALSIDVTTADAMRANLDIVTAGVGTTTQTLKRLGQFRGPGTGAWGQSALVPLKAPDGSDAAFKITTTGNTTFRVTSEAGDFDWFVFYPATGVLPIVQKAVPADNAVVNLNQGLEFQIEDFSTTVVISTVKLELDGANVTASVTKAGDITTVRYTPPANFAPDSAHNYKLTFADNQGTQQQVTASFRAYPVNAVFTIEAEDFDYDSGSNKPAASVMPYLGGAYDGLAAVVGVDYQRANDTSSDVYRKNEGPAADVPMNDNLGGYLGRQRGLYDVTVNYKIGWIGDGQWFNYTRTIPTGNYNVYAALSYDGTDADLLRGSLDLVEAGTPAPLGIFRAPGTRAVGGWGGNALVPLVENAGEPPKVLALGGQTTVRWNASSGDFDYLVLVPATVIDRPRFTSIKQNTDGTITVEWTGGGTLEYTMDLGTQWVPATGATSPYTFTPQTPRLFGRIKK